MGINSPLELRQPCIFLMGKGSDDNPVRVQKQRVGPDRATVHVFVVDVGDLPLVQVYRRSETFFQRRGVGMPGNPEENLWVGSDDVVDCRYWLGDKIGRIDESPVIPECSVEWSVKDDDGWFILMGGEGLSQPGELTVGKPGQVLMAVG